MSKLNEFLKDEVAAYAEGREFGTITDEQVKDAVAGLEFYINEYLSEQIPEQVGLAKENDMQAYFKREGYYEIDDGRYYVYLEAYSDDCPVVIYNDNERTYWFLTDTMEKLINAEAAEHLINEYGARY